MEEFNKWLGESIEIYCNGKKDPHDVFPYIDLTDAKLSFLDDVTPIEYAKTIKYFKS